jgi:integrase
VISELTQKEVIGKAVQGEDMTQNIIRLSQYRETKQKHKKKKRPSQGKKGSVYARSGKLWVDFRYLGHRVREPSGLSVSRENKQQVRRQLDLIMAEIENGVFEFANRFPHSTKRDFFSELEGKTVTKRPDEVTFGAYAKQWLSSMAPGMGETLEREYQSILNYHLLPFFSDTFFSDFTSVLMKKFLAQLKGKKNRYGKQITAKRIRNVFIPLRVITKDAIAEYGWTDFADPFFNLKLPRVAKFRVHPFSFEEWAQFIKDIPAWYRPYFEFAVQTGLRPSEQVALKWQAIDHEFIHVELSRVGKEDKATLKTHESCRRIKLRPQLVQILAKQKELTEHFASPYVFVNMKGQPVTQENLRCLWIRVMKASDLLYRRMYETRHTFASWALGLGETPEWVARMLGHVDTSMVYRIYGRYIPNLTNLDGSVFDSRISEMQNKKGSHFGHNFGHNREKCAAETELTSCNC